MRRGTYLYLAFDSLLVLLVFAVLLGLGGASMAAVEGEIGVRAIAAGAALEALIGLLIGRFPIIPWAAGVTYLAKRLTPDEEAQRGARKG